MSEVVIIRRKSGDDGAAVKGGAWKIAYADFVTAMMAFFLVMWLINASNEATRAQVASYFNPIKLTDNSTGNRGLTDPKDAPKKTATGAAENASKASKEGDPVSEEDKLLDDPAAALDRIAGNAGDGAMSAGGAESRESSHAIADGQTPGIGDPFDPRSWEAVPEAPAALPAQVSVKDAEERPEEKLAEELRPKGTTDVEEPEPAPDPKPVAIKENVRVPAAQAGPEPPPAPVSQLPPKYLPPKPDIAAIERYIFQALGKNAGELKTGFAIRLVPEGALISLTDLHATGMFRSGSSEPGLETIALIAAIAGAIKDQPGYVVVRGHTDSVPYRGPKYDNWQLSTARAHMTQYMLIRGGLDEKRIRRVEGLADREPLIPSNPEAPENRRIEILLGVEP